MMFSGFTGLVQHNHKIANIRSMSDAQSDYWRMSLHGVVRHHQTMILLLPALSPKRYREITADRHTVGQKSRNVVFYVNVKVIGYLSDDYGIYTRSSCNRNVESIRKAIPLPQDK